MFKFDQSHSLGYILPHVISEDCLPPAIKRHTEKTSFYLPLSDAFDSQEIFDGVDLLPLFLQQLRRIVLKKEIAGQAVRFPALYGSKSSHL